MTDVSETRQPIRSLSPDHISSLMSSSLFLMDYEVITDRRTSQTQLGATRLGLVDVYQFDGYGQRCSSRKPHHICKDRVEDYILCLPLQGSIELSQDSTVTNLYPGQFGLLGTTSPFCVFLSAARRSEEFSCYSARLSGAQLKALVPSVDKDCNLSLKIRSGASSVMQSLLQMSLKEGNHLPASQAQQLGMMTLEMVANSVLGAPELRYEASYCSAKKRTVDKAKQFIDSHLGDPELTVGQIAEHCHVSIRSLQVAFAEASIRMAPYIQQRRLECCRRALRNPALLDVTTTQIALSWGFNSLTYFSRVYRERFGLSPREDRNSLGL